MARAGYVKLQLSSVDALLVAEWLETWHPTPSLFNLFPGIRATRQDEYPPAGLNELIRKSATRRRPGHPLQPREIELPRKFAQWASDQVRHRGGLFGFMSRSRTTLPSWAHNFCVQCEFRLRSRPGRPALVGEKLRKRLSEEVELRHKKRLRKRQREADAAPKSLFDITGKISPN